jgi:hypothetical protein
MKQMSITKPIYLKQHRDKRQSNTGSRGSRAKRQREHREAVEGSGGITSTAAAIAGVGTGELACSDILGVLA